MERQKRSIYETLAELTGENLQDVKLQIDQSLQRFTGNHSPKITIISGSFPENWPQIE